VPDGFTRNSSVIDNYSLSYIHDASDYASQGGLRIQRRHRFRSMTEPSSFGPGVFSNYDIRLHLYNYGDDVNVPVVDLFDATASNLRRLIKKDGQPAVFQDCENGLSSTTGYTSSGRTVKELRLYDAQGQLVSQHYSQAATAVLELWTGDTFRFEIVQAQPDYDYPGKGDPNDPYGPGGAMEGWMQPLDGRLTQAANRHGRGTRKKRCQEPFRETVPDTFSGPCRTWRWA
jgi:hypothetical protein